MFVWSLPQAQQLFSIKKFHLSGYSLTPAKPRAQIKVMLGTTTDVKCGLTSNQHGKIQGASTFE